MLAVQSLHTDTAGAAGKFIEWGISFAKANNCLPVIQGRKDFAKPPDAALVEGKIRDLALAPKILEPGGTEIRLDYVCRLPSWVDDFQQVSTSWATKILCSLAAECTAANATELGHWRLRSARGCGLISHD